MGLLYDSLVRAYNCKYAWYVASGLTGIMIYILVFHFFFSYTLASKSGSLYDSLIRAHNRKYAWYEVMNL